MTNANPCLYTQTLEVANSFENFGMVIIYMEKIVHLDTWYTDDKKWI